MTEHYGSSRDAGAAAGLILLVAIVVGVFLLGVAAGVVLS